LGESYFTNIYKKYKIPLQSIGSTLEDFYNNLGSLNRFMLLQNDNDRKIKLIQNQYMPSLNCFRKNNTLKIILFHENLDEFLKNFYFGLIKRSAELIWKLNVSMESFDEDLKKYTNCYRIKIAQEITKNDFYMESILFKKIFPFTIIFDRKLDIQEAGDGFAKYFDQNQASFNFLKLFNFIEPIHNKYNFEVFLNNQNIRYKIQLKEKKNGKGDLLTINGSFIYIYEYDYLLFIGSPSITSLEELNNRGMYISDIPLYDATRDLIMINEQTKAQVREGRFV
jgi:hypothetical protein